MATFPLLVQLDRPQQPSQQRLTLALTPDGMLAVAAPAQPQPERPVPAYVPPTFVDPGHFQVNLDVHHFAPEELSVKVSDRFLIIEAGHAEKREEHGWVKRSITRRYALPENCNVDAIECRLSSDGVLCVTVPTEEAKGERVVPIVQTGPVRSQAEVKAESGDQVAIDTIALTIPV